MQIPQSLEEFIELFRIPANLSTEEILALVDNSQGPMDFYEKLLTRKNSE